MLKNLTISAAIVGAMLLGACEAASDTATTSATGIDAVRDKFPSVAAANITPSPVAGWFEIDSGKQILYVSADGNFALSGDLIDLNTKVNLTDLRRNESRKALLAGFSDDEMIVFGTPNTKHKITVFTDIDCGYCRKLHQEMASLNSSGIEVRYMFFPRSGPNTPSWEKATTVWCSDDRNSALTKAKAGAQLAPQHCDSDSDAIAAQYKAGKDIGLRGTPAIVTDTGELIAGYLPAATLLARLDAATAKAGK